MQFKEYILTFILVLLLTFQSMGQGLPSSWDFTPSTIRHHVSIPSTVADFNGEALQAGDAIGAFYSGNCVGYVIYPDTSLWVYGKDSLNNGYSPGDTIKFKIWRSSLQCASYKTTSSVSFGSLVFESEGMAILSSLHGTIGSVAYPKNLPPFVTAAFCDHQPAEPPVIQVAEFDSVLFNVFGKPLILDSYGKVDPVNSPPGAYTIGFESATCLLNEEETIKIGRVPVVNIDYKADKLDVCNEVTVIVTGASSTLWKIGDEPQQSHVSIPYETVTITFDKSVNFYLSATDSNWCIFDDTIPVYVSQLKIDSLLYSINQDQVTIDTHTIKDGLQPYVFYLKNSSSTFESSDGRFNDLENGEYIFEVRDRAGCTRTSMTPIKINTLDLSILYIDIIHADCNNDSKIVIDESTIANGMLPYTYRFISNTDTLIYTTPIIENIPVGQYTLMVMDNNNISRTYKSIIEVKRNTCEKGILVFGATSNDSGFFVPYNGKVRVYDRNGMLIKEFFAPGKWDGTDIRGELVPMGDYVIVHENEEPLNVTVIR